MYDPWTWTIGGECGREGVGRMEWSEGTIVITINKYIFFKKQAYHFHWLSLWYTGVQWMFVWIIALIMPFSFLYFSDVLKLEACLWTGNLYSPTTFFTKLLQARQYSSALTTPGPGTKQLRKAPTSPNPLKLFRLSNHKLAYPASPIPSCKNHNKVSYPCFPFAPSASWSTLVLPPVDLNCECYV